MFMVNTKNYQRGFNDAYQDRCEGAPFASIGGMDKRLSPILPDYIRQQAKVPYLNGYMACCQEAFGDTWKTDNFQWIPAIEIRG